MPSFKERNNRNEVFKKKRLAYPYSLKEGIKWFYHYLFGPNRKNKGNIQSIPSNYILNNEIKSKYTLTFIGDIMDLSFRDLIIGESVKKFIKGTDYLIGNFEATITNEKKVFMDQRHSPQIMDALELFFPPDKTFLSTANNHGGDFGLNCFSKSVEQLKKRGFNVFGTKKTPYVDITNDIRIVAGTMWSNRPCNYLVKLKESYQYLNSNSFNILFPHWGFEMELFPRLSIIEHGKRFLKKFDAIIGHHSHCPQPITFYQINNYKKLIVYSLGDFCFGLNIKDKRFKFFQYGIILKAKLGIKSDSSWHFGEISWNFIKTTLISEKEFKVEIVDKINI
ncbi:MAG: CapA family protein [Promethearchaeota archaeon]